MGLGRRPTWTRSASAIRNASRHWLRCAASYGRSAMRSMRTRKRLMRSPQLRSKPVRDALCRPHRLRQPRSGPETNAPQPGGSVARVAAPRAPCTSTSVSRISATTSRNARSAARPVASSAVAAATPSPASRRPAAGTDCPSRNLSRTASSARGLPPGKGCRHWLPEESVKAAHPIPGPQRYFPP